MRPPGREGRRARPDGRSSRPGSTCRSGRRWSAATSTTCPARASRSPTSASTTTRTGGSRSWSSASTSRCCRRACRCARRTPSSTTRLDKLTREADVRRHVEDFNERVIAARYRLPEGPPLVTMPRDVDETVAAWRERRTARIAEQRRKARETRARRRATPSAVAASAVHRVPVNRPSRRSSRSGSSRVPGETAAVRSVIPTPTPPLLPSAA